LYCLGGQLAATKGRPAGFDYLRIGLAVAVIAWHTVLVTQGLAGQTPFWTGPFRPLVLAIVPSFFALSGFLVAGSFERHDLTSFLALRGLRIFPALAVEVFISALAIGPLLTRDTLKDYFSSPEFVAYFLNIVGNIHYTLPGLFHGLPAPPLVNAQLWTVPYELDCYAALAVLALVRVRRWPLVLAGLLTLGLAAMTMSAARAGAFPPMAAPPFGLLLVSCFLLGFCLHALRDRVPFDRRLFALALLLGWASLSTREGVYLSPIFVSYATVYLGLLDPPKLFLIRGADYSYGVYLYGFPIQQTLSCLFPSLRLWYVNLFLTLAVAGPCAFLSWRLVESKVLARKGAVLAIIARARSGSAAAPVRALA
jgi:peptidoglycan/LPS O-acetylase OafA/YrhL